MLWAISWKRQKYQVSVRTFYNASQFSTAHMMNLPGATTQWIGARR